MSAAESVLLAWDVDRFALDTDSYTEAVLVAGYDRGLLTDAQMEAALEALEQDLSNTVDIQALALLPVRPFSTTSAYRITSAGSTINNLTAVS